MFEVVLVCALILSAATRADAAPLPIAEAVARARTTSPLKAGAEALAAGADTAARLAGRALNPAIDLRVENLTPRDPRAPERDVFAVVSQPIEFGGKRDTRKALAGADRDLAGLVLDSVERQIALDTVRAYMRAVRARDALTTLGSQREGVGTLVSTMRRRVEEGFAPESDLLRFETEASRLDVEASRTRIELTRALFELGALMGASLPPDASDLVSPEPLSAPDATDAALNDALDHRPDVRLASVRLERAQLAAGMERQRRIPDPMVSAGYKRTQGYNTAVAGVLMAVPLFDRNAQARALADAAARAAAAELDAVRTRATADARAALASAAALSASAARVQRDLLAPAEGVRSAAQAMFREGATDVLKLVDAERVYSDVRREALSLATDAYIAVIEARFALAQEQIP